MSVDLFLINLKNIVYRQMEQAVHHRKWRCPDGRPVLVQVKISFPWIEADSMEISAKLILSLSGVQINFKFPLQPCQK